MKSMFTKGLNGLDTSAMSATDAGGLYAHNFMANMANTTWGASALGGAAIGGVAGGVNGGINGQGIVGSAASGAVTGAMFGVGGKFASNIYSKNAAASVAGKGFMKQDGGKYETSFLGTGDVPNPFQLGLFVGKA
jgi:hypothetical protein